MLLASAEPSPGRRFRAGVSEPRPLAWGLLLSLATISCGSRSVLSGGEAEDDDGDKSPPAECQLDSECDQSNLCAPQVCGGDGFCRVAATIECRTDVACTEAKCEPTTGACIFSPSTSDLDGDGFRSPLPGYAPGAPDSCGDDCDDTNPAAYPGGIEYCDGADNDCDGVIDNDTAYLSSLDQALPTLVRVASDEQEGAGRRGIAYGDGVFGIGYWGRKQSTLSYLRGLDRNGEEIFSETSVASVNAPSFGTDLAWSGNAFGVTWSDARVDDNYEVYFARFDSAGSKLGPDLRLTDAPDFSIHSRVIFDQGRYVLVWDDRRDELSTGGTTVYGQLIDDAGEMLGENILLTEPSEHAEYPYLAATSAAFGVVYTALQETEVALRFRAFDKAFNPLSPVVELVTREVRGPRITALGDLFLVTWDVYGDGPGEAVMGVLLTQQGQVLLGPQALTSGSNFARSHDAVSLGDRILLFWVDDADGNYELYAQVLDGALNVVEDRRRLTDDEADTLGPEAVLGDAGHVGVVVDDWRSGTHQTYFVTVGCGLDKVTR